MSQNITIKEGDISQGFGHINKLRTSNGSDHDRWVPEDEVDTESLHVDKNGLYYTRAYEPSKSEKKKGKKGKCYGYDSVTVSIINKTSGKDSDGNPISVGVDDEGNLTETQLPVRIEIVTPPTETLYLVGEPINTAGMVVKAYNADDTEWGVVPSDEYTIAPLIAPEVSDVGYATSDLLTNWEQPIPLYKKLTFEYSYEGDSYRRTEKYVFEPSEDCSMLIRESIPNHLNLYWIGKANGIIGKETRTSIYYNKSTQETTTEVSVTNQSSDSSVTINNKTAYTTGHSYNFYYSGTPSVVVQDKGSPDNNTLWTAIYGNISYAGSTDVVVTWERPEDAEELTDTFGITVRPRSR